MASSNVWQPFDRRLIAVPFWGWMVIGALYYVICFTILYRLFLLPPSPARSAAFTLLGAVMFINALWNYFFFRTRNLFHAYLLGFPYSAIAISLFLVLLLRVDRMAAWCFAALHSLSLLRGCLGVSHLEIESPRMTG